MPLTRGQSEASPSVVESETATDKHMEQTVQQTSEQANKENTQLAALQQQLETQLKVTQHLDKQTQDLLALGTERKLQRHKVNLEERINTLHTLVTKMIELKFESGLEEQEITEWSGHTKEIIENYEYSLETVEVCLEKREDQKQAKKRDEINALEEEKRLRIQDEEDYRRERNRKRDEELELKRHERFRSEQQTAKLPKLEITKFKGTCLDWYRFWEQFEAEVDKSNKAAITKFSYLRELLTDQPKTEILGLPFSEEGYDRAKEILKKKYGVTSEIVQAHGKQILKLPTITTLDLKEIHEFYRILNVSVNSLKTLKKLDTAEILVSETLEKLGPIKSDLTRTDPNWQDWGFEKLLEALRDFTLRNPEKEASPGRHGKRPPRQESFRKENHYRSTEKKVFKCVYCESTEHRSSECDKVKEIPERREFLKRNKLCYNCTGTGHGAATCRSRNCGLCGLKHHTSLCTNTNKKSSPYLIGSTKETIHPTLVVVANGEKFRVLLDTGSGSSFASSTFIKHLGIKPTYWEWKNIETMTTTVRQKLPIYATKLCSIDGKEQLDVKLTMLDKPTITTLSNPRIGELKKKHPYLRGIPFDNEDEKVQHPIHLLLGVGDLARIKTSTCKIGDVNQPVAEKTTLGWTLMGPGEIGSHAQYFANTSHDDYQLLYSLDVLGLEDRSEGDQSVVHDEFKEQLQRRPDGSYSTSLPWKPGHPPLQDNAKNARARLDGLLKKLQRGKGGLQQYHSIIQEQLKQGIVEPVPEKPTGEHVFYLPHRPVIKESAETTKVRIVYDASARENHHSPSLNDCLQVGPPLQPLLHDVVVRNRLNPIGLTADVKQAFHQIWINPKDRDAFRFYWISDVETKKIVTLRFTRVPFGCVSSPFLLGATLQEHLSSMEEEYPDTVAELKKDLYVDDVITGGAGEEELLRIKHEANVIFNKGGLTLHKWHSSLPSLEDQPNPDEEQTYAKEALGTSPTESKMLGIKWNKVEDTLAISFQECKKTKEITKRGMLSALAKVYDPLGLVSPVTLEAKHLYRKACETNATWDGPLEKEMEHTWNLWLRGLPDEVAVPRSICKMYEPVTEVTLHVFGDASKKGCCAAVYGVVKQGETQSQGLLASKSRIAKKNLTIPRLELVSAHMAANLVDNVQTALEGHNITGIYGWSDSTVVLCWINNTNKEWKQFVANRVAKIRQKTGIQWKYCPTGENPADIGSRGAKAVNLSESWWKGPKWLAREEKWPKWSGLEPTKEVNEEARILNQLQMTSVEVETSGLQKLTEKYCFWKVLRVVAWILRFISNVRTKPKTCGVLSTKEIQQAEKCLVKITQKVSTLDPDHEHISLRLGLEPDKEGVLHCKGRVMGEYPVYIPTKSKLARLVIQDAHTRTLHGGVSSTMAKVRERWWIEKLRRLVKTEIHNCYKCKRFRVKPLPSPPIAQLPRFRTQGERAFQTVGVDFAGPLEYKISKKQQGKSYIALYTCAASRAVYLDLLPDLTAAEFKRSLGEFIARRGNPTRMVSDNGKTFVATARWLHKLKRNQLVNDYLARMNIEWQFNLSRSPWWGGFFERMVGLMKASLRKAVGRANLTFKQLKEVLVDVEVTMNNRPLGYMEEDFELPPLTPNTLIHGANISLPEEETDDMDEGMKMCKRAKYIQRCKDMMWRRWTTEYIRSLRERRFQNTGKATDISVGEIMLIKGDQKNRGHWRMGVVQKLVKGKDGITRGAKLKTSTSVLDRPLQLLYPMELKVASKQITKNSNEELNPGAEEFKPKEQRAAKMDAIRRLKNLVRTEQED